MDLVRDWDIAEDRTCTWLESQKCPSANWKRLKGVVLCTGLIETNKVVIDHSWFVAINKKCVNRIAIRRKMT